MIHVSITDKMRKITNFFNNTTANKNANKYQNKKSIVTITKTALVNYIEEYKGVRRLILLIVLWINIHIFFVTVNMYKLTLQLDQQWVIFAGYWAGIFATIVAFYTSGRTKEQVTKINKMQNIDEKQVDPWKFKPNDNIKVYDVDDSDNIHEGY